MQIGDIDVVPTLLDLESRINFLEKILEHIANNNVNLNFPNPQQIEDYKAAIVSMFREKYPNMNINPVN